MITIPKFRGFLYALAKILGDANAIKTGRVGRRIARRLAGKATGRGLGRLFPAAAMIALAACSTPADDRPLTLGDDHFSTLGEHLELAASKKYGGTVELIEPEILDRPIGIFARVEQPSCAPAAEATPEIFWALGTVPIARVTFADETALLLFRETDTDDPDIIVVYVFTVDSEETCLRAVVTTGPLP